MSAKHLVVHGTVQGVFYRASACERADELGVAGWVRNVDDGSVEMHVEGADGDVEAMVAWAHEGPAHASVSDVVVTDTEPRGDASFVQA